MKNKLITLCALWAVFVSVRANGGPVDYSSVLRTGNVMCMRMQQVTLLQEDLSFHILGDYCEVKVQYRFRCDNRNRPDTVGYGFPVDFVQDEESGDFVWNNDYIKNLLFSWKGKKLAYTQHTDLAIESDVVKGYDNQPLNRRRKWYLTRFIIQQGETASLTVSYRVKCNFVDWGTSKSFFVTFGEKNLYWDFSPAQYFSDGTVERLNIKVTVAPALRNYCKLRLSGLPFVRSDTAYSYSAEKFDFAKALPLHISYNVEEGQTSEFIRKYTIPASYLVSVHTSSQKADYPATNLTDKNYGSVWVPQHATNEWVEITTRPFTLGAILIGGGYSKSADLYARNNRIKKVQVDIESENYRNPSKSEKYSRIFTLDDKPYVQLTKNTLAAGLHQLDLGEGILKVKKIKITLLDVYKGSKSDDTCIAELFFLGYLPHGDTDR